jgi:ribonucleoside-diphosphate reductase alpha chain
MFSLDLDHPDVLEFLDAKLEKGMLTHANVSVRSKRTSEFIKAVKKDGDWELSWKGQYRKTIKAKMLWDKIVKNAYDSAEPGFLNFETAEDESNIYYVEKLTTSNPCGEQILGVHDCCDLGHIVLSRFVRSSLDGTAFMDLASLGNAIRTGIRMLDNVLTVNTYPLPEMKEKSHRLRRVGLGTTALADTLALLGFRYGSEQGNKFIDKLYRFVSKAAYEASVLLAVEKGPFPACNPKLHIESGFMRRMPEKIRSLVLEQGIRNCALLTQAPTGTVSILSGNCSSGIEPMFAPAYQRRFWKGEERKTETVVHPLFAEFMRNGKDVSHFAASREVTVRDHMEVQSIIQKHVDNAVSKTINMAQDFPMEEMGKLWLEYLPRLKGTTFYRENTRGYVDKDGKVHEPPLVALSLEDAKKCFSDDVKTEAAIVDDCPSGVCAI